LSLAEPAIAQFRRRLHDTEGAGEGVPRPKRVLIAF